MCGLELTNEAPEKLVPFYDFFALRLLYIIHSRLNECTSQSEGMVGLYGVQ